MADTNVKENAYKIPVRINSFNVSIQYTPEAANSVITGQLQTLRQENSKALRTGRHFHINLWRRIFFFKF